MILHVSVTVSRLKNAMRSLKDKLFGLFKEEIVRKAQRVSTMNIENLAVCPSPSQFALTLQNGVVEHRRSARDIEDSVDKEEVQRMVVQYMEKFNITPIGMLVVVAFSVRPSSIPAPLTPQVGLLLAIFVFLFFGMKAFASPEDTVASLINSGLVAVATLVVNKSQGDSSPPSSSHHTRPEGQLGEPQLHH